MAVDDVGMGFGLGSDQTLEDNWMDGEGYYLTRIGEVIAGRFQALAPKASPEALPHT